jgi:hypothetical protein
VEHCKVLITVETLIEQAATSGNGFWAAFCNGYEEGIDCLTGEEGQLDTLLASPLHLGNVLDYGADPKGVTLRSIL